MLQPQVQPRTQPATQRATIKVRDLRLRTFIGFNPEERTKRQDVVINLEIRYDMPFGALEDRIEKALDYKVITKKVIHAVEQGRFLLLEKLVGDVLAICSAHPGVRYAAVTAEKPHALRFADSVSLTLEYHADTDRKLKPVENSQ
jgi:D-erythro-7,8-dihydroneopterin triphosphate epimerase